MGFRAAGHSDRTSIKSIRLDTKSIYFFLFGVYSWGHLYAFKFIWTDSQTVFSCWGSHDDDQGPLSCRWARPRCEWAFQRINTNDSETGLQNITWNQCFNITFALWLKMVSIISSGLLGAFCVPFGISSKRPNFIFWIFWSSSWYHIEIWCTHFSIRVYLA